MENKQGLDSIKHFVKKNKLHKLGFDPIEYATNVVEELLEMLTNMESNEARMFAKATVSRWIDIHEIETEKLNEVKIIDSIADIMVYSTDAIMKQGYCVDCVLTEVGKEINSRRQDPEQAKRWVEEGPKQGEKWQKDLNQPQEEKYQADFSKCKLTTEPNSFIMDRFTNVK